MLRANMDSDCVAHTSEPRSKAKEIEWIMESLEIELIRYLIQHIMESMVMRKSFFEIKFYWKKVLLPIISSSSSFYVYMAMLFWNSGSSQFDFIYVKQVLTSPSVWCIIKINKMFSNWSSADDDGGVELIPCETSITIFKLK